MKNSLLVAITITTCLSTVIAKAGTTLDPKDAERKRCVDSENTSRKQFAKDQKIGNMVKLEYDKEIESVKPIEDFECPNWDGTKYSDGYWAVKNDAVGTCNAVLASKVACINNDKCGMLLVVNRKPDQREQKNGKPGSACSGKSEGELCIGSAASTGLFLIGILLPYFYL